MERSSGNLLLIFIKNPIPGKVKTRLGKDLGHDKAVEFYKKLLAITRKAALGTHADKHLYYGDFINYEDEWSSENFTKKLQEGTDLGERMHRAFENGFAEGYSNIVIIGSDCPEITTKDLNAAFEKLLDNDLVIGPANDGGYYLLGLRKNINVFKDKDWSTESVFRSTIHDAEQQLLNYSILEEKTDLDTIEDLKKFPEL